MKRAGMASGTADLQRDLGGAIMQSILGALLTAGYAAAVASAIAAAPNGNQISDKTEAQLEQSFAGAETIAKLEPQYAKQIIAGAQSSFVDGADWAYLAGIVAILLGFALVYFFFPKKDKEQELLATYAEQDTRARRHLDRPLTSTRSRKAAVHARGRQDQRTFARSRSWARRSGWSFWCSGASWSSPGAGGRCARRFS